MRYLHLFVLFLLFTAVEVLLFNVHILSRLSPLKIGTVVFEQHDVHQHNTYSDYQHNNTDSNEQQHNTSSTTPWHNTPTTTSPSQQLESSKRPTKQRITQLRAEKELKRYTAALARGTSKTVNVTQMWYSDPKKYECYLKSDFECYSMAIPDPSVLPESFRNACAPAFLIVGTAKSGTTSLYFYLVGHPQVHQAISGQFDKEVRYFSEQWSRGPHWYLQQFPPITRRDFPLDTKVHMINGEASPTYFYDVNAPARVQSTLPNAKLIIVLRDPVERTYSDKMQLVANKVQYKRDVYDDLKFQIDVFSECFEKGKQTQDSTSAFFGCYSDPRLAHRVIRSHPFVMDSIYVYQLRNWLQSFSRHQLLFIKGEDMYSDGAHVMDSVASFLGLCEDWNWDSYVHAIHNRRSSPYQPMPAKVRKLLEDFYREFTLELYKELGVDFQWASTQN